MSETNKFTTITQAQLQTVMQFCENKQNATEYIKASHDAADYLRQNVAFDNVFKFVMYYATAYKEHHFLRTVAGQLYDEVLALSSRQVKPVWGKEDLMHIEEKN
jgi:hypothetical protein